MKEVECRYYFSQDELSKVSNILNGFKELEFKGRYYEKTIQYDVADEKHSFYNTEIDGRFRVRISESKTDTNNKLLLSWKRRLKNNVAEHIHQEEEVELNLDPAEYKNLTFILENVLKMKKVESYERYRSIYLSKEVEIVLDEFPFGLALEIESLTKSEDAIKKWLNKLKLDINRSYRYSWDDKYAELCQQQKKTIYNNVTFELDMPKVEEKFDGKL